jgi:hypothetical protein
VKRSRERDNDPNQDQRDESPQGPLWVEPIAPPHGERARYGLPLLIAAFVVLTIVVAMVTRFVTYYGAADAPTESPPGPTPISWIDSTVQPLVVASPTALASALGSVTPSGKPAASALPSAAPAVATAAEVTTGQVISIRASIDPVSQAWYLGTENHFTLELTNTSPATVYLSPCPVYRMYITGTDPTAAQLRLLNCAAIGGELQPGQTISLDMVYVPTTSDPLGPNQQLVWQCVSPENIQATGTATVYLTTEPSSRLAARGPRLAASGSRLAARGSRPYEPGCNGGKCTRIG